MRFALVLALLLAASGTAPAETRSVPFGALTLTYDPALWHRGFDSGTGALVFSCIAPDCAPGTTVFGVVTGALADPCAADRFQRDAELVAAATPMNFEILASWSGCRARDAETLSACATHGGRSYRLVTALGGGCNFAPEPDRDAFIALLRGIAPAE